MKIYLATRLINISFIEVAGTIGTSPLGAVIADNYFIGLRWTNYARRNTFFPVGFYSDCFLFDDSILSVFAFSY